MRKYIIEIRLSAVMFREVRVTDFDKISCDDKQLKMVLESVAQRNTEGRSWKYEQTYFLWDKGNIIFYIFGEGPSSECLDDLKDFFEDEIKKDALEDGISFFKLHNLTDTSTEFLLEDREYRILEKYFYGYNKQNIDEFESSVEGLRVIDLDEELLESDLMNVDEVSAELKWMWPSLERYKENGFGKAAIVDNEIACWCTAEYVSKGMCGIGIETLEKFRHKGIATKTAAEFVRYCVKNGITPFWEADKSNEPSVKLAEKLGFDKVSEYQVYLSEF